MCRPQSSLQARPGCWLVHDVSLGSARAWCLEPSSSCHVCALTLGRLQHMQRKAQGRAVKMRRGPSGCEWMPCLPGERPQLPARSRTALSAPVQAHEAHRSSRFRLQQDRDA